LVVEVNKYKKIAYGEEIDIDTVLYLCQSGEITVCKVEVPGDMMLRKKP